MLAIFGMHLRTKAADPASGGTEPVADGLGESAVTFPVDPTQADRAHRITVGRSEPHKNAFEATV
jgi:hypothetical protein